MKEGGLISDSLTVQVLCNALVAKPSKSYLIDGFPRTKEQAILFEKCVGECQAVLFFELPRETMIARCLERAKTSGRADDTEEVIEKRIKVFEDQSRLVVDMYKQFGKVREVSSAANVFEVWNNTRAAILPHVSFMVGPKNVDTYSHALAQRTNSKVINFTDFVREGGLRKADDDTKILGLIQRLADEVSPRVLLTGFPQTEYQARFFIKNAGEPRACYVLNCSKDFVQAEMMEVPQNSPGYVSSA